MVHLKNILFSNSIYLLCHKIHKKTRNISNLIIILFGEVVKIKTFYIEKMDKHKLFGKKIEIQNDNIKIWCDLEKEKNIKKLINKIFKNDVNTVILDKTLWKCEKLVNTLYSNDIKIFDGRWLEKHMAIDILNYIISKKEIIKAETEIAITVNEITELSIELIKILAKQYKKLVVVTNHIDKLRKIEKDIHEKEGILIIVSNNKNKSLMKSQIILNMDFNKELLNQYKIFDEAIIINIEGDMKLDSIRFQGIIINDFEIETGRKDIIWREDYQKYNEKDLLEANLYARDTFKNIRKKIQKSNISVKSLYGINGIINL